MDSVPENLIKIIKSKTIDNTKYFYKSEPEYKLKMTDRVMLYNSGDFWKLIPLPYGLSNSIIYDTHASETNDQSYPVTICICPITLRTVIFKGIFIVETYDKIRMIVRELDTDNIMPIDMGYKIDNKYIIESNKRSEVKIMTHRNALTVSPDVQYFHPKNEIDMTPIMGMDYYTNNLSYNGVELNEGLVHPKTLVYIIQYKSHKTEEDKLSIVLGRDAVKDDVTGYDIKESGLLNYLAKYQNKLINRNGYVIPMLWYLAKEIYQNARIIYIF